MHVKSECQNVFVNFKISYFFCLSKIKILHNKNSFCFINVIKSILFISLIYLISWIQNWKIIIKFKKLKLHKNNYNIKVEIEKLK